MEPTLQAILAAAVSFFVVTLILAVIFLICKAVSYQNRRRIRKTNHSSDLSSSANNVVGESASFDPSLRSIDMAELISATKNFSAAGIIGDGGFGLVYKATLSNGVTVAVKKLSYDAFQGLREFRAEMDTLGKLRHPNIVQIQGYCVSGPDRLLIYEFIEKGSLDQWLHMTSSLNNISSVPIPGPLSWELRMKIVEGVARGLHYLHHGLENPIIHRDIKASNVLLDANFDAHIADFGLARRMESSNYSHVSTQVAGTTGYMPPEYKAGVTLATPKADVYSFGILMFEIVTGTRPNLPIKDDGREVGHVEWARRRVVENRVMEMVDPMLSGDKLNEKEVKEFFRIACMCTSEMPRDRPTMNEVVALLNSFESV